jgi:hypothetical protein
MYFWFATAVPKYLNFATFSKVYYESVNCDFVLQFGDETQMYT